jgi:micrococcal nuclease
MRIFLRWLFLLALLLGNASLWEWSGTSHPADAARITGTVVRVIDGDTAVVKISKVTGTLPKDVGNLKTEETVRYIGIDTPELSPSPECFSAHATERNELLTLNKEVTLQLDIEGRDRFGRLLAYVFLGEIEKDELVQDRLINGGFGWVIAIGLNIRHIKRLLELQRQAIQRPDGLWHDCSKTYSDLLNITIVEIQFIGDDEILTLASRSQEAIHLAGWKLVSLPGQVLTFPNGCVVPSHARLRVHSGPKADRRATDCSRGDFFWTTSLTWHNDGDNAILQTPRGVVVDYFEYKGGHSLTHPGH